MVSPATFNRRYLLSPLFSFGRIQKFKLENHSSIGSLVTKLLFAFFSLLILFTGCESNDASIDLVKEKQKVIDTDKALLIAETQRDLEKTLEFIGEGAIFHPASKPPIVGREAIRSFYKEWFKIPYAEIVSKDATVLISDSGDLACLIGNSYMGFNNSDDVDRTEGKYISIWKKVNDKWLCFSVSWSGNE